MAKRFVVSAGQRVRFEPNPASLACYSYRVPESGAEGTVTPVAFPGRSRTYLPGPGGGLVYVRWDAGFTVGVSPLDVVFL